jgi:SulP family sulfate permease
MAFWCFQKASSCEGIIMIDRMIPAASWLRSYRRRDLKGDTTSGLIVAIMLVPQGMAYAMLAGLPPVTGLYAATVPVFVYALFGSSRHLAVGPVAVVSLLVFSSCSKFAPTGTAEYIGLTLMLALMTGIIQLTLGVFRLGFLTNFFSHAVISGFTSAAAVIIILSQIKLFLGIKRAASHSTFHLAWGIIENLGTTHGTTLMIGVSSIAILVLFRKKYPIFPASLLVVVGWTVCVWALGLHKAGVQVVGDVPRGLPPLSLPLFEIKTITTLVPAAFTIFFVGYMEALAVAKIIAAKKQYTIDPDQELRALGLANISASFFSAYPVTGGFSRTAVNYETGGQTGLSSIVTAGIVILTLLFLTPLFYYLPTAVLAAIIITAVYGLIDIATARDLFTIKKVDGWTLVLTFCLTLIVGPVWGLLIGLAFSLIVFIWRSAYPHIAELGYLEKDDLFRNVMRFPDLVTYPHIVILRIDAPLYFANLKFLEDRLHQAIIEKPELQWIVLDMADVSDIDAVAIHTLEHLMDTYGERNIDFLFTDMIGPVRDLVEKAGWTEKYGDKIKYLSVKHALRAIGAMR